MRKSPFSTATVLVLASALVAVAVLFTGGPARSAGDSPPPVKWEYRSMIVESGSMPAKVTELANEGWEIEALQANESVLEQAGDAKPHLLVEKYVLIARRPAN